NTVRDANAGQNNWIDYYGNQQNCYYTFDTLAITDRYVSFDGSTEPLHQQFTYQPVSWLSNGASGVPYWNTKQTTVKTTDQLTGQITYTNYLYNSVTQPVVTLGCSGDCAGSITWPQIINQIP